MKNKKLVLLGLCGALGAGSLGAAYAYFTNTSDKIENTFSVVKGGRINDKGEIIESDWNEEEEHDFVPGATVSKSPQFKNTASYPVYVYMEVSVPNMENSDLGKVQVNGADLTVGDDLVKLGDINTNWKYLGIKKDSGRTIYLYGYNQALENDSVTEPLFTKFNVLDYTKYLSDKELSIDITARCVQTEGQSVPSFEGYKVFSDGLDFITQEIKSSLMSYDKFKAAFSSAATQFVRTSTMPLADVNAQDFSDAQDGSLFTWYDESSKIQYWYSPVGVNTIVLPSNCPYLFQNYKLESLDMSCFDTSNVVYAPCMFDGCSSLQELNLSKFNTSKMRDMQSMFKDCSSLEELDTSNLDTSRAERIDSMFMNCSSLQELDVSHFNIGNAGGTGNMFYGCSSLKEIDVSHFDTSKVRDMSGMFCKCRSLQQLNLTNFNTSDVRSMSNMFQYCESLKELDLSSFNTSRVYSMVWMFSDCTQLVNVIYGDKFVNDSLTQAGGMFTLTMCNKPNWT